MLKVYSDDLGEIGKLLNRVSGSLNNPQPLMRNLAVILENSTRKRFETKITPDGEKWADWADSTKIRYAKKVYRSKNKKRYLSHMIPRDRVRLLKDKGVLLRSITRHATAQMAQVGTNVEYAPYHQTGTRKMVARPMFGISSQDRVDILDELQRFVKQQWEQT